MHLRAYMDWVKPNRSSLVVDGSRIEIEEFRAIQSLMEQLVDTEHHCCGVRVFGRELGYPRVQCDVPVDVTFRAYFRICLRYYCIYDENSAK